MKAIICIIYPSKNGPLKYGEFQWNHAFQSLVWRQRIFDLSTELKEFHACADKTLGIADMFPRPTIRFIAEETAPIPAGPVDLMAVPIADLVEIYRERSREAKVYQLGQARAQKKALAEQHYDAPPVPSLEESRMEGEGGAVLEPAMAA